MSNYITISYTASLQVGNMKKDRVDLIVEQWRRERPDLATGAMATVARIVRASKLLERGLEEVFREYGLASWGFDVLATLRRAGSPYQLSPKRLSGSLLLSAGALTNRLDRLQEAGWIRRLPDPEDRRGLVVELTAKGRRLVDRVVERHVENEARLLKSLSQSDLKALNRALHTLLLALDSPVDE